MSGKATLVMVEDRIAAMVPIITVQVAHHLYGAPKRAPSSSAATPKTADGAPVPGLLLTSRPRKRGTG
jgi:hypothetical protein